MPSTSPIEQEPALPEQETTSQPLEVDPDAPLSFVPHDASGALPTQRVRIRTGRYGELEEHELIRLLDTIEDERARSRFRESIYISCFVWLLLAWVAFYGPRYLWHAPKVVNPMDVLKEREMTQLNFPPSLPHVPAPAPKLDSRTLERLRTMTREREAAAPAPAPKNLPSAPTPAPPVLKPSESLPNMPAPVAPAPTPRTPPPVVADAPRPQPSTRPNFNTGPSTAGDAIQQAIDAAAHDRSGGGAGGITTHVPGKGGDLGGDVQVLSDLQGVDFSAYLRRLKSDVYRNWLPLLPEEINPPLMKQGETYIRFTILPDGRIGEMHLDGSTHDDALNRAAWGSITSEGQFQPLPSAFHGPNLELRFHYLVNKGIE